MRCIALSPAEVPHLHQTKHPLSIMMLGVVGGDGKKMPPYFFPTGTKVDQWEYQRVLENYVVPWIEENYTSKNIAYVWQQVILYGD